MVSNQLRKHEAHPQRVKMKEIKNKKEFRLDSNNLGFICAGLNNNLGFICAGVNNLTRVVMKETPDIL